MKFMKLGAKPDCYQIDGSNVRYERVPTFICSVIVCSSVNFMDSIS